MAITTNGARCTFTFDVDKANKAMMEPAAEGLEIAMAELRKETERLCPKERGYNGGLVSTLTIELDKESLTATARYKARHAWLQHEKINYKHRNGEQAKYLEAPIMAMGPRFLKQIEERVRAKTGR